MDHICTFRSRKTVTSLDAESQGSPQRGKPRSSSNLDKSNASAIGLDGITGTKVILWYSFFIRLILSLVIQVSERATSLSSLEQAAVSVHLSEV